jgi:hypothetical protein
VDTPRLPIQNVTGFAGSVPPAHLGINNDCDALVTLPSHEQASRAPAPRDDAGASVEVREACFDDYAKIANLQARYELEVRSYEEWSHLWINNPVYRGREWWPIGWVLETGDKEIVGYIGNIPLLYEFQGRMLLTATGRAFVVDEQHRSHSFMLLDRYFRQPKVDLHLNTTVNAQAVSAYGIFRAMRVPVGEWDQSAFWITNHRGFVESLLKSRSIPLAGILSFPISLASRLRELFSHKELKADSAVQVDYSSSFDDRFEAFWAELKTNNRRLLAVRDRETLEWHFRHSLLGDRIWILTVGTPSRIDAYAIFFRDDNPKFDLKRMRLVDFQALNDGHHLLLSMLASALQRCRAEGIHMLEIIGYCPEKREVVDGAIPYRRQLPSWMYFYRTKNRELAEQLKSADVWDPSGFDGDSSF